MKHLTIFAVLLAIVAGPAIFGEIGGERPVSTPVYRQVTYVYDEAIASDGNQFMAVWTDGRSGRFNVYASRIATDGTVLDPMGIDLGAGFRAGIAWNGESYVVVWSSDDGGMAATLSPDGSVKNPPVRIWGQSRTSYVYAGSPIIASNGLITVAATDFEWVVLDARLHVVDTHSLYGGSVYRSGNGFTLVTDSRLVHLDSSGHQMQMVASAAAASAISCHDERCIEVYADTRTQHLTVVSYDPATQATGTPVELSITAGRFSLVSTNSGYLLVTADGTMLRFNEQGFAAGAPTPPCCPRAATIATASDGVNVAVLRLMDRALSVTMVTPSGSSGPRNVATSANAQFRPAITGNGSNYLIAWWEPDGFYFGRVGLEGTILDDRGRLLTRNGTLSQAETPSAPSVVFDGTSYIVATSMQYDEWPFGETPPRTAAITISRIDPTTGMVLNTSTTCGNEMCIARNDNATVAVWLDCNGNLTTAYIDGAGALSTPIPLALPTPRPRNYYYFLPFLKNPRLAWNGTEWLVTWEEQYFGCDNCPTDTRQFLETLHGMTVSAALFPGSLVTLWSGSDYETPAGYNAPSSSRVASDGHDFLVVWDGPVGVRHVSAAGIPLHPSKALPSGTITDLVWDGAMYSAARLESHYDGQAYRSALVVTRLSPSGEASGSTVINAAGDDAGLFSFGHGNVISAYTRVAPETLYGGVERVFFTLPDRPRGRAVRSVNP